MDMNPVRQSAVIDSLRELVSHCAQGLRQTPEGQEALERAETALAAVDAASSALECATVLVATTGHVTRQEAAVLDDSGYSRGEYGWLIFVGGDTVDDAASELTEKSDGLRKAITVARGLGARYLLLDRDADPIEGVPVYNW